MPIRKQVREQLQRNAVSQLKDHIYREYRYLPSLFRQDELEENLFFPLSEDPSWEELNDFSWEELNDFARELRPYISNYMKLIYLYDSALKEKGLGGVVRKGLLFFGKLFLLPRLTEEEHRRLYQESFDKSLEEVVQRNVRKTEERIKEGLI